MPRSQVGIRLSDDERERIERLVAVITKRMRETGVVTLSSVARAALNEGLDVLERREKTLNINRVYGKQARR